MNRTCLFTIVFEGSQIVIKLRCNLCMKMNVETEYVRLLSYCMDTTLHIICTRFVLPALCCRSWRVSSIYTRPMPTLARWWKKSIFFLSFLWWFILCCFPSPLCSCGASTQNLSGHAWIWKQMETFELRYCLRKL